MYEEEYQYQIRSLKCVLVSFSRDTSGCDPIKSRSKLNTVSYQSSLIVEMALTNLFAVFAAVALVGSTPAPKPTFWKGTPFDTTVEEMRSLCTKNDAIACIQFKAVSFLDNLFQKDTYKVRITSSFPFCC